MQKPVSAMYKGNVAGIELCHVAMCIKDSLSVESHYRELYLHAIS